jgi:hypothetical protein
MERDPGPAPATRTVGSHVDRSPVGLSEIPEHARIAVAENRPFATGKHGSHPVASAIELSHRVDAAVNAAKASIGDAPTNSGSAHTESDELPVGHGPVLPTG